MIANIVSCTIKLLLPEDKVGFSISGSWVRGLRVRLEINQVFVVRVLGITYQKKKRNFINKLVKKHRSQPLSV